MVYHACLLIKRIIDRARSGVVMVDVSMGIHVPNVLAQVKITVAIVVIIAEG